MTEAHRLNMVGGHFIWLWIDTSSSTGYFHQATAPVRQRSASKPHQPVRSKSINSETRSTTSRSAFESNENRTSWTTTNLKSAPNYVHESSNVKKPSSATTIDSSESKSTSTSKNTSNKVRTNSNLSREDQSSVQKINVDFSQGFDPFHVLQRQDEQLKQTFGTPQHYQERNAPRDSKQTPKNNNRLILGLRGDGTAETEEQIGSNGSSSSSSGGSTTPRSKKTRRNSSKTRQNVDNVFNDELNNGGDINFSGENVDIDNVDDDDDVDVDDDDNGTPIFLSNKRNSSKNSISSKYRNFSDDNLDDFIDNNNFNENHNLKLNFKRTSTATGGNSTSSPSFVNFHQFKDFPVGLLALRPIKMNVDRYFIRAAVRLFAATWEKINSSKSIVNTISPQQRPTKSSSSSSSSTQIPQNLRRMQQNRNAQATTIQYNAKKFDNEMQSRKMRRKRNINTINQLLMVTMHKRSIDSLTTAAAATATAATVASHSVEIKHEHIKSDADENKNEINTMVVHQTVPVAMQVNSSLFLNEFNSHSDKNSNSVIETSNRRNRRLGDQMNNNKIHNIEQLLKLNSSFTSDLSNNKNTNNTYYFNNSVSLTNVNVSFNRNFSGLWKQNSKNKSNIHSLNSTRQQQQQQQIPTAPASTAVTSVTVVHDKQAPLQPTNTLNVTNSSATILLPSMAKNHNDPSIESMAKQASQSIVENFFGTHSEDMRQPPNKRQNTRGSVKKEQSQSFTQTQHKRPQHDANNKNANQLTNGPYATDQDSNQIKCETPTYYGGCYGTSTKQDVKNAEYFSR